MKFIFQIKLQIHIKRCNVHNSSSTEQIFELVELSGYFRKWISTTDSPDTSVSDDDDKLSLKSSVSMVTPGSQSYRLPLPPTDKTVFVATGRLVTPQLIRDLPVVRSYSPPDERMRRKILFSSFSCQIMYSFKRIMDTSIFVYFRSTLVNQSSSLVIVWSGNSCLLTTELPPS